MKNYLRNSAVLFSLLGFLSLGMLSGAAWAKEDQIYTSSFSKAAVGGYDVTSYFDQDAKPVKGTSKFKTKYKGAEWHFASQANLDKFVATPDAYAPQFGGYCAWAVSQGYTAKGDPLQWTVYKDKLYLNYNAKINKRWTRDKDNFIVAGNKNWPEALDK